MSNFNLNKVIIAGRLTSDLELKQTPSGVPVVSGSIAVNQRKKATEEKPQADFFSFVAWRSNAEVLSKYFHKGSSVCLLGSLQNRSYSDNGGVKRYITEINVDEVKFVDSKSLGENQVEYTPDACSPSPANFEDVEDDGDLPF